LGVGFWHVAKRFSEVLRDWVGDFVDASTSRQVFFRLNEGLDVEVMMFNPKMIMSTLC